MLELDLQNISQSLGIVGLSAIALVFTYKKIFKDWNSTSAETSIITLMHSELERMSDQNTKLSTELGKLQTEVIELNKQLRTLTLENQRLHAEVVVLTREVSRLQSILQQGGTK